MATQIDARVKQKTGTAAEFAGYTLLEGEIALVRTSASGPVWNFKVGPGNFDDLDWSLQNPGAAQEADTSTVFPAGVPGLYIPTEDGTYEGVTVDLSAGYVQLIWDGENMVKVEFPINLSGYVATSVINQPDGVAGLDDTGKTPVSVLPIVTDSILDPGNIITGKFVGSDGSVTDSTDSVSIVGQPISGQFTIGGFLPDSLKYLALYDASDSFIQSYQMGTLPRTITPPPNTAKLSVTIKRLTEPDDSGWAGVYISQGESSPRVTEIGSMGLLASGLIPGSTVSDPVEQMEPVNLRTLNNLSVLESELEVTTEISTVNLLDMDYLVRFRTIDSAGNVNTSTLGSNVIIGNHPLAANFEFTISGIAPDSLKKIVFRDSGGNAIGPIYDFGSMPRTFTSPAGTVTFDCTLRRAVEPSDDVFEFAALNPGGQVLPYEPHKIETITGIGSKRIAGQSYDQSLDTTDDVKFNSVEMAAFKANLPEGAGSPPVGVEVGDAWIDTTDNTIKVRRS